LKASDLKERHFFYDYKEIVENLIKAQGLHEGLWRLVFDLGLSGTNVNVLQDGKTTLTPTGMVLIQRIGIVQVQASELNDLTVDAAVCNPRETPPSTKRRKGAKKRSR
jgi:hypothetical protein